MRVATTLAGLVAVTLFSTWPLATQALNSGGSNRVDPQPFSASGDEPTLTADEAWTKDVSTVARALNVSESVAADGLRVQESLDLIDFDRIDPQFVAHEAAIRSSMSINYLTTATTVSPAAVAAIRAKGILLEVKPVQVPLPYEPLLVAQAAISKLPELQADSYVELRLGAVVLESTSLPTPQLKALAEREAGLATDEDVKVVWKQVESLAQPALPGGRAADPCTGGFVVKKIGASNRGLTTAGHCDNSVSYSGFNLNFKDQYWRENGDVQWHDHPDANWSFTFADGSGGVREVNGKQIWQAMDPNDVVCKFGKVTGYDCGEIDYLTICPSYVSDCNGTFVRVNNNTDDMAQPGDSGGTSFLGPTAYGLISGHYESNNKMIFMPQQYINEMGVSVGVQ